MQYEKNCFINKTVRMKKIVIGSKPFAFSEKVTASHGGFSVLPEYQLRAFPVGLSFSVEDLSFFRLRDTRGFCSSFTFREQVIASGHIPLDAQCAQAIIDCGNDAFRELYDAWRGWAGGSVNIFGLQYLGFFGSMYACEQGGVPHIISFSYESLVPPYHRPACLPFEAGDSWHEKNDAAVVFSKDFARDHILVR